jgi:hypothetical protein
MNDAFAPVMAALIAHWGATTVFEFAADATKGSPVLTDVSSFNGLFDGLPMFGPGIARGATILSMDPQAQTLTLSDPVAAAGTSVALKAGFLTIGRRVKHWSQVTAQPALFLRRIGVSDEYDHDNFFSRTTLECEGWIYCDAGKNPDAAPDDALATLEQLVRQSFAPDGDYGDPRFTLGGLVHWCRFEGRGDISPGDQGTQALARLPIRITLP